MTPAGPIPEEGTRWGTDVPRAIAALEKYAADVECPGFPDDNMIYEAPDGETYQLACPSSGIIYAPPLLQAALAEIFFPGDWSIIPPG